MMCKRIKKLNTIFLVVLFSVFSCQENQLTLEQELQAELDQIMTETEFPGATMTVVLPDDTVLKFATGYSFPENNIKMKPADRMLLGSTGKTFVSAVMLMLIEEGKIALDDKVSKYFGEEKWFSRIPNHEDLTIRNLAHHNGGLPRYIFNRQFGETLMSEPDKVWKPLELLSYIFDTTPAHPAGDGWAYSDTDYILIGMIIERVCGNSFYDEVAERILRPLALNSTGPSVSRTLPGQVQGHSGNSPFLNAPPTVLRDGVYFINPQFEWTGGGFISNSPDLARWAKKLYSGKFLSESLMDPLLSPVSLETGKLSDEGYGTGVFVSGTEFGRKFGHTGLMPGYITELGYYQDHDFSIAMQINQDNDSGKPKTLSEYSLRFAGIIVNSFKR